MRPQPPSSFGNDITNTTNNNGNNGNGDGEPNGIPPHIARMGGILTCSPIAGRGVIKVVGRCEDAKENNKLNLSECELTQVPEAIYHLMRNTSLNTCDLSGNVIKRLSPKFAIKFNVLTDLNLSNNQISKLPDEMADLKSLIRLDISHNNFIVLPPVVFKMPKLSELNASYNEIIEINTDQMITSKQIEVVDLRHNPLCMTTHKKLKNIETPFRLEISEYNEDEDF